jgi:hypothetical protein
MQITLQLNRELALWVRKEGSSAFARSDFGLLTAELGIEPKPLHPEQEDPVLACFFSVDAPDHAAADRLVARLLATPGIEAAYLKPLDETPADPASAVTHGRRR